jgi:hypothetical protein
MLTLTPLFTQFSSDLQAIWMSVSMWTTLNETLLSELMNQSAIMGLMNEQIFPIFLDSLATGNALTIQWTSSIKNLTSAVNAACGAVDNLRAKIESLPEVKVINIIIQFSVIGGEILSQINALLGGLGGLGGLGLGGLGGLAALQYGGIVTRPTLALIGEHGPEAVVPLERGYPGYIEVYMPITIGSIEREADEDRLVMKIRRALAEELAWRGK